MNVIEAAYVNAKTMADGTLRLTFDVEPRNALAAFTLFAKVGQPVAIAALATTAQQEARAKHQQHERMAPLCEWAVKVCAREEFWQFLSEQMSSLPVQTKEDAAAIVKEVCRVGSRKDLDLDPKAADRLHKLLREPYAKWLEQRNYAVSQH